MKRKKPALRLFNPQTFVSHDTPHGCSLEVVMSRAKMSELFRQ